MRVSGWLLAILFILSTPGVAQERQSEVLTNADVVRMIDGGLSAAIVSARLQACGCDFDVSASALLALSEQGVPDSVILAMVEVSNSGPSPSSAEPGRASVEPTRNRPPLETIEFPKTKQIYQDGNDSDDRDINLLFTYDSIILKHRKNEQVYARIPYESVESVTYERSEHPRTKTAIFISPLALFSSSKKHWLTVTYDDGGTSNFVLMQLDKNEQQRIVATAETRLDVEVERLIEN